MIDIVIVCHKGELEIKTLLLVWSLKRYLRGKYCLNIAIPIINEDRKNPNAKVLAALEEKGCKIYYFTNNYINQKTKTISGDRTSNKIYALKAFEAKRTVVFLDSDILALRNLNFSELLFEKGILLKPANIAHAIEWQILYKEYDIKYPKNAVEAEIDKISMPPYFNSGVLLIKSNIYVELINKWEYYFRKLSGDKIVQSEILPLFNRDQVALSLAIQSLNIHYALLGNIYNYPIRGRQIRGKNIPHLVHYHTPFAILSNSILRKHFRLLVEEYPWILQIINKSWEDIINSSWLKRCFFKIYDQLIYRKYRWSQKISRSRSSV